MSTYAPFAKPMHVLKPVGAVYNLARYYIWKSPAL